LYGLGSCGDGVVEVGVHDLRVRGGAGNIGGGHIGGQNGGDLGDAISVGMGWGLVDF